MQSYSPLQTTETDFAKLEKKFFEEDFFAPEMRNHLTKELFPLYSQLTGEEIKAVRGSYWNLYVYGVWTYLGWFSQDQVIQLASKQIPDAFRLGFDVYDKFIWYMQGNIVNWLDIQTFYEKLKYAVINSDAPVGEAQGQVYTLGQLIKQLQLINSHKDNSLETAQFYDFLTTLLFLTEMKESVYNHINVDPGDVIINFVNFANFILNVESEQIIEAIEEYTTPIPVAPEVLAQEEVVPAKIVREKSAPNQSQPQKASEQKKPASAMSAAAKPTNEPEVKKPQPMNLVKVRQTIDAQFKKDASGQYEDIAGALEKLGELAENNNDPKIAEMLYFDEQAGVFKWVS
jgi:hypothetical protein